MPNQTPAMRRRQFLVLSSSAVGAAPPPSQFLHQLPNRFFAIRYHAQRPNLPVLLRHSYRNRLGMDIQTDKLYSLHRPAPFDCGSVLLAFRFAAINPTEKHFSNLGEQ